MKKIILSLFTISLLATSCDTNLDINRNPDALSAVPLKSELPAGIAKIIGAEGSYYALIGGFWSQYWTQSNAANQYKDIDGYTIGSGTYFAAWRDMYDALGDIRQVKRVAFEQENWNYYLIATTLEVQASQVLTDFYGSIPYEQANKESNLNPSFNSGQEVYNLMISDLDQALSKNLANSKGEIPRNDDLIFQGNMTKWTKLANTMKLKVYMRQTVSSRASIAASGINALLTSGVSFLDTDAAMSIFTDSPNLSNPLFESDRRQLNVATNLRASTTLFSYFTVNADPRKAKFYGAGVSALQGNYANNLPAANTISVVNLSATTPAYLMSLEESLFLQAEANARFGTGDKALFDAAVIENFNKYGLSGAPFVATGGAYEYPTAGTLNDKIKAIITQKWIAGFPGNGFEAFFDKNRTGFPKTSAVLQTNSAYVPGEIVYSINGATQGMFPKRIVYPQEERNTNSNAPLAIPITTPVWWSTN